MKQFIIHAGFPKTATSSIQNTCANNRNLLEQLEFYYPSFKLNHRIIQNHSSLFVSLFKSNPDFYHGNLRMGVDVSETNKIYQEQLNDLLKQNHRKILVSGEGISSLTESELEKMKWTIQSYDYEVRIIVFVRSPRSNISSVVQQKVKAGHFIKSLNIPLIKKNIDKIESVFPNAEFFSFRDACHHKDGPVGYFLKIIGVDDYSEFDICRSNDSISNQATRIISFINQEQPYFIKAQNNIATRKINPFRRQGDTRAFWIIKGDKFQLNKNELEKFERQLDRDNKYLLGKFGASFCDSESPANLKKESLSWSDEHLEQLKSVISNVDENIRLIVYDYFKNVVCLDKKKISYIFFKCN